MRPVRNVFQKLSRTEQRREGVVAYLWPMVTAGIGYLADYSFLSIGQLCWRALPLLLSLAFHWLEGFANCWPTPGGNDQHSA
jgi:hypothetical protein